MMAVGNQANKATIDGNLSSLAQQLVAWCNQALTFQEGMVTLGANSLAGLVAAGYSNTPNAANPGGVSDAQWALNAANYMNTLAQVAEGTVAQTPAFNFINQLSSLWAGNLIT